MQVVRVVLSLILSLFGLIKPKVVQDEEGARTKTVITSKILGMEYDTHLCLDRNRRRVVYEQSWIPNCNYPVYVVKNRLRRNAIKNTAVYQQTHRGMFMLVHYDNRVLALLPAFIRLPVIYLCARARLAWRRVVLHSRVRLYDKAMRMVENYPA